MNPVLKDTLFLLIALIGALATVIAVIFSNRDTKRTMAVSWGVITAEVKSHGETLKEHSEILQQHTSDIGYLQGKANGAAASR
jgi:endonuclease III